MFLVRISWHCTREHDSKWTSMFMTRFNVSIYCHATDLWTCWWSVLARDCPWMCALSLTASPLENRQRHTHSCVATQSAQSTVFQSALFVLIQNVTRNVPRYAACLSSTAVFAPWDGARSYIRNDRLTYDESPWKDVATAEFRRSNLHWPFFLCRYGRRS